MEVFIVGQALTPKQVIIYENINREEPYTIWLMGLDRKTRQRIEARMQRVALGLYGDHKSVGEGVFELRFFFGSGYRVYFGEDQDHLVLLLCAGDKSSQIADIQKSKIYWQEYKYHDSKKNI
jgi:putative addiction module killer protein